MPQAPNPVLRRKLGAERPVPEFGHVTPAKALSLALSRAAQDVLRVPMSVADLSETRVSVGAMAELIPDSALCLSLAGPGAARGLAALDPVCLASVVEAQTRGRIEGGEVAVRPPTGTDAILCNGFLGALLRGFANRLAGHPAQDCVAGYAPGERLPSLRLLPHALPDTAYRAFTAALDIAGGLRRSSLVLILPWDATPTHAPAELAAGETAASVWTGALRDRVLDSPAGLEAVLCRLKLSLAEVAALRPGARLNVPMRCLGELSLEAAETETPGVWQLGQADGMRALRLAVVDPASRDAGNKEEEPLPDQTAVAPVPAASGEVAGEGNAGGSRTLPVPASGAR